MTWVLEELKSVKKITISGDNNNIEILSNIFLPGTQICISGKNNNFLGKNFKINNIICDYTPPGLELTSTEVSYTR